MSNETTNPVVKWILIGICVIIVLGAVLVFVLKTCPDDYQVARELHARGFAVAYEHWDDSQIWKRPTFIFVEDKSITPEDSRLICQLPYMFSIDFSRCDMSGWNLDEIGNCQRLHDLIFLDVVNFPAEEIEKLAACSARSIILRNAHLKDSDLEHFAGLTKLSLLDLQDNAGITDAGLEHIEKMSSLRSLDIKGTSVTQEGIEEFKKKRPDIEVSY